MDKKQRLEKIKKMRLDGNDYYICDNLVWCISELELAWQKLESLKPWGSDECQKCQTGRITLFKSDLSECFLCKKEKQDAE